MNCTQSWIWKETIEANRKMRGYEKVINKRKGLFQNMENMLMHHIQDVIWTKFFKWDIFYETKGKNIHCIQCCLFLYIYEKVRRTQRDPHQHIIIKMSKYKDKERILKGC